MGYSVSFRVPVTCMYYFLLLSSHCEYGLSSAAVILLSLITPFGVPPQASKTFASYVGRVGLSPISIASIPHHRNTAPSDIHCCHRAIPVRHPPYHPPPRRKSNEESGATHLSPPRPTRNRALCLSPILPDSFFIRALFCSTMWPCIC